MTARTNLRPSHKGVGEQHYAARLSWADVRMIRHRAACPVCDVTQTALAIEYGVSKAMVTHIVGQRSWHPEHDPMPQAVACPGRARA